MSSIRWALHQEGIFTLIPWSTGGLIDDGSTISHLAEKEISYESHAMLLNKIAMKADNLMPEYLSINPNDIVPTLIHNGTPIFDSWEIIKYLDHGQAK